MKILSILWLISTPLISAETYSPYGSNGNLCKKLPLQTSADVINNLSSFSTFYVKFGNCAYSIQTNGEERGGGGGDEGWYQGFAYTRGANVAYSLYGSKSGFGGCSQSTFINSFYTLDGLYSFTQSTGISLSSLYTYGYNNGEEGENKDNEEGGGCTTALTCGDAKKAENSFIQATFSGGTCSPSAYSGTTDTLSTLNSELDKQSCAKISSDTALNLLTYSQTCTALSGSQCPDPHGLLADCEQKYKEFDAFVLSGGKDPSQGDRFLYGSLLYVLAFLIYGFALQKKEKADVKSVDAAKFIDHDASTDKESSLEKPKPIQNVALSFARTVSYAAQGVSNVVKEVMDDDDDDDEVGAVPKSASYVPPNDSEDYVGETSTTDTKPKKKKGLLKKLKKLMKRK